MKTYISLIIGFTINILCAQQLTPIIYCNDYQNVALIMDEPIAQAITGSEDFVFSYNQTAIDSLGLLQGKRGKDSNLLIRTADGGIYNLLVKYSDSLSTMIHFISPESRVIDSTQILKEKIFNSEQEGKEEIMKVQFDYNEFAAFYLRRNSKRIAKKRRYGIELEVQGMYYNKDLVYITMDLKNKSGIDFVINDLSLLKIHGIRSRKSSYQKIIMEDLFRYKLPEVVRSGSGVQFVMVYPKFTVGRNEKLEFLLNETSGSRFLKLRFKSN